MICDKFILIVSTEEFGENYTSKLHYANYLSKNNKVYYLCPVSLNWKLNNLISTPFILESKSNSLIIVKYGNPIPRLNKFPKFIQAFIFKFLAKKISKRLNVIKWDIVWSFDPSRFFDAKIWNSEKTISHWVEIYNNPFFIESAPYRKDIVLSSDIVIAVAEKIKNELSTIRNDIHKVNHGADIFNFGRMVETKLQLKGKIKVGLVGNFQFSINFQVLFNLLDFYPTVDFYLIGPYENSNLGSINDKIISPVVQKLKIYKNAHLIGSIASPLLISYLKEFDINLIVYGDRDIYRHCNPHKMMGYFYAGGITVSNFLDEYKDKRHLLLMANEEKEIEGLFKYAIENLEVLNSEENKAMRRKYAENNSYTLKIEEIEKLLLLS